MKNIKIVSQEIEKTNYYKGKKIFNIKCCFLISITFNITMIIIIFLYFYLGLLLY